MPRHRKGPDTETLAREYNAGATSTDLAQKYGMHHVAVIGRLRRAGHEIRPARARAIYDDGARTNQAVSLYESGTNMAGIAALLGTSHTTIQRTLAAAGVRTRPHGLRNQTVRVPTDTVALGYLCGLFDGEGNLQIREKHDGVSVASKISIYSTTAGVMDWLLKNVGGVVRWDHKRTEKRGWLPIGAWSVYRARDVAVLLRAMLPHLIVKRETAIEALRIFGERFDVHGAPPSGN